MSVQNRLNIDGSAFVLQPGHIVRQDDTIKQDAQRVADAAGDIVFGTVVARISTGADVDKWVPLSALDQQDGASMPTGIYVGADIAEASVAAGDVESCPILITGVVDRAKVVLEGGLSLTNEIAAANNSPVRKTIEQWLAAAGIILADAVDADGLENA